ncbi:hypothetical protein [Urbifossiella limnaea]|uniref:Uncharacterized protein n=1 Tax=Urbifossiella limnaea TaxID=2528023 RepID=A0A517XQT9_9BACT|nr:hypothetical protein [Urbifossiella limnaea]QDU19861.1 hypothetical protein ETAA1_17990 [Urbifossiella limnaea]
MTRLQQELAQRLRLAAGDSGDRRVVYRTEYLGYLPFGQYHWVLVGDEDVSSACPEGWEWSDLEALADAGVLARVSLWVNPQDDSDRESQYDVAASPAEPSAAPDPARL